MNIYCLKLKKELPALARSPYPGALGERIVKNISEEAWQLWLKRQTLFINEGRLKLTDAKARDFLKTEMEKFLFEDIENTPEDFVEK